MINYIKKQIGRFIFGFFCVALVLNINVFANSIQLNKAFASFIKSVYRNTESAQKGHKFCIFGSDAVSVQITPLFEEKKLLILKEGLNMNTVHTECRVIYVAKNKQKSIKHSIGILNRSSALTIATFSSFVSDQGMVSVGMGRRNFELTINSKVFKDSGVKLDSSMTGLVVDKI